MRSSRDPDTLGAKIGPKLIAAVTQSVIATKKGLMPTEHALRVLAMQEIIDRAGEEFGSHIRPFAEAAILANPKMDPVIKDYLGRTASGKNQWQAVAGHLAMAGAGSVLSTIISNEIAPLAYTVIAANPNLRLDVQSASAAAATGIIAADLAYDEIGPQGFDQTRAGVYLTLAESVPDYNTINELVNRGLLTAADGQYWIMRAAYAPSLRQPLGALREQLLTVADAALGVLRNDITVQQGYEIAAANGYTNADFDVLVLNTGEPPGLMQLLEAYRRGYIDQATLEHGIRESRVRDEWIPVVEQLRYEPMSAADAIEAYVKGYLTLDQAQQKTQIAGLLPDDFNTVMLAAGEPLSRTEMADLVNWGLATVADFQAAIQQSRIKDEYIDFATDLIQHPMTAMEAVEGYVQNYLTEEQADVIQGMNGVREADRVIQRDIAGIPLSLGEMLRLWNRGDVTQADVEQAIRESHIKDKYIDAALNLAVTLPSIYEIRLLLQDGAISNQYGTQLLTELGYPADVVTGIIEAFGAGGASSTKAITQGMLTDLYLESALSSTDYINALEALGYSAANAALIKEVADWKIELTSRNALLTRVREMYVNGAITEQVAQNMLTTELVPSGTIDKVMADWNAEIASTVKLLTEAQVIDAWQLGLFQKADYNANLQLALTYLEKLHYSAADAKILLSIKNKGAPLEAPSGQPSNSETNTSGTGQAQS